ncbi:MAG: glycosyltransferase family 87 protein [Syntrophobacterales bacterium]
MAGIIIYFYALGLIAIWANCDRGNPRYITDYPIIYDKFPESDFLGFWAASSLALEGNAREAYNPKWLIPVEGKVIHPQHHRLWFYPPPYLIIVLPLALVPFLPSLFLWGTATLAGFVAVLRRIAPHPLTIWLTLAFPACFHNLVRGQNAFLSGIIFGSGLLLLDYHPLAAGLVLGLMVFKPQLAVLIPVVLLAGRYWRTLAGFVLSALGMILLSLVIFGFETWSVSLQILHRVSKTLLIPGYLPLNLNSTVFSSAELLGLTPKLALWVHYTVAFIIAGAAIWTWYQRAPLRIRGSTLIIGTLFFAPRLFVYDLTLLAIPLAFLGYELALTRFSSGPAAIFVAAWLMPFYAPILAANTPIQIGPLVLFMLLLYFLYEFYRESLGDQKHTISIVRTSK